MIKNLNIKELMQDKNIIELLNDIEIQPLAIIDLYHYISKTYIDDAFDNNIAVINRFTSTLLECYPDILEKTSAIPDNMFYMYKCDKLEIPSNITEIGSSAFAMAHIGTLKLPRNIEDFGFWAFYDCAFNNLIYEGTFEELDYLITEGQKQNDAFSEMIQEKDEFESVLCLGDKEKSNYNYLNEFIDLIDEINYLV